MGFTAFEYATIKFCVENPKAPRKDIITMKSYLCKQCWHRDGCKKKDKFQLREEGQSGSN